jgi:PhzF family phenazine biosynthesis protein
MTSSLPFFQIDAFANQPFKGNPAAVFVLDEALDDALMLNIAKEMNLSETAFILKRENANPLLRWFTPMFEVDLCGHATLASAHTYMTEVNPDLNTVIFDTKCVGPLKVEKTDTTYQMDFPSRLGEEQKKGDIPEFVLEALTPKARPHTGYKSRDLMLVYDDEEIIRDIDPDYNALMKYKDFVIVTAKSNDSEYDFVSRFFCPGIGVPEDPVTGSAHCTLTPYWAKELGKTKLKAHQASARGGDLEVEIQNDRVLIAGNTVTVIQGILHI